MHDQSVIGQAGNYDDSYDHPPRRRRRPRPAEENVAATPSGPTPHAPVVVKGGQIYAPPLR